ncbi:YdcF family protein [Hydrogenimonas sp. SS33]|uniref:YdcF family protein n=1 Tax=Hydrogenimonas leucolamina TaxID=2954236 RepID=UPI00336BBBF9
MQIVFNTLLFFTLFSMAAGYLLYRNLGYLLDVSQKPRKADIIVVLGGDWSGNRVKKAYRLYKEGYSESGYIGINERSGIYLKEKNGKLYRSDREYLRGRGVPENKILSLKIPGTTIEEVRSIKELMLSHGFRSVLIVTDPPHTRRVEILANDVENFREKGLEAILVSSDPPWWKKETYFQNRQAKKYALNEAVKIPLNYIAYGILDKLHLLGIFRRYFNWLIHGIRDLYERFLIHY